MTRRLKSRRYISRAEQDLIWLIELFLERHSGGLYILLGTVPLPDSAEIAEMIHNCSSVDLGVRVQGGESVPEAQRIVEAVDRVYRAIALAGGIERINKVFCEFKHDAPSDFALLRDHTAHVKLGRPFRTSRYCAATVADRWHMHPDTLRKARNFIIARIAQRLCYRDDEGLMLSSGAV